jgi:Flp pilus assembly protein TadD
MNQVAAPTPIRHLAGKHNVGKLSDAEITDIFFARQQVLADIMADLASAHDDAAPQHHLIIGQRGMGKTSLLRRIEAELRTQGYRARFLPLAFPEEQYMRIRVNCLSDFWLNCMDALANAWQREGDDAKAKQLDVIIRGFMNSKLAEAELAAACKSAFDQAILESARRPVLLLDNFPRVMERLKNHDWALRAWLQAPAAPLMVAASVAFPVGLEDYAAAFYDSFKTCYLNRLNANEVIEVLRLLAQQENRPTVLAQLAHATPRLTALHALTGGNPRTVIYLYQLLTGGLSPQVEIDLKRLMDDVNAVYEPKLEAMAEQARTVFAAVALIWRPAQLKGIQQATQLSAGVVSGQLARLEDLGLIERVEIFGSKRGGFQVAERLFNIWYLDRIGSRRDSAPVESLALFLEAFYTPDRLRDIASGLLKSDRIGEDDLPLAFATARVMGAPGCELRGHAQTSQARMIAVLGKKMSKEANKILKLGDVPPEPKHYEFAELELALEKCVPTGSSVAPGQFAKAVLGCIELLPPSKSWDIDRNDIAQAGRLAQDALTGWLKNIARNDADWLDWCDAEALAWLKQRMLRGFLTRRDNVQEWEATLEAVSTAGQAKLCFEVVRNQDGLLALEEKAVRQWVALAPDDAMAKSYLGYVLHMRLARYTEAEMAYRAALQIDPKLMWAWNNLGNVLSDNFGKFIEAEQAYRTALEIDPKHANVWANLGRVLAWNLGEYAAAEQAYRTALELEPNNADGWNGLGNLLADYLGRTDEAERAYSSALKCKPNDIAVQHNLVFLLRDIQGKLPEAASAFAKIVESGEGADSYALQRGLFAAYAENWGEAKQHFSVAFEMAGYTLSAKTHDDWYRTCAVLLHLNLLPKFLALMDELDATRRMVPLAEALRAHEQGERGLLQNSPAEVRPVAEKIYDEIAKRRANLPIRAPA